MHQLEPPHSHHLRAAIGWIELGNPLEAEAELSRLPDELGKNAEVLSVRWEIQAKRRDWVGALLTASTLISAAPTEPEGWIKQSYSLHELKRTREALEKLEEVERLFPEISIISYNLACYACQLGNPAEALRRLKEAMRVGGKSDIKSTALKDPDLRPLWDTIRDL